MKWFAVYDANEENPLYDEPPFYGEWPEWEPLAPDPLCPKCGKATTYWEGHVDQDEMGNDIDGYWWTCHECQISSKLEYV